MKVLKDSANSIDAVHDDGKNCNIGRCRPPSFWWGGGGGWKGLWWCWSQQLNNNCSVPVLLDGEASTVTLHVLSAGFPSHQKVKSWEGGAYSAGDISYHPTSMFDHPLPSSWHCVQCTSTQVGRGMSSKVPLQKRSLLSPCNRQEHVDDDDGDGDDLSRDSKSKCFLCEKICCIKRWWWWWVSILTLKNKSCPDNWPW